MSLLPGTNSPLVLLCLVIESIPIKSHVKKGVHGKKSVESICYGKDNQELNFKYISRSRTGFIFPRLL